MSITSSLGREENPSLFVPRLHPGKDVSSIHGQIHQQVKDLPPALPSKTSRSNNACGARGSRAVLLHASRVHYRRVELMFLLTAERASGNADVFGDAVFSANDDDSIWRRARVVAASAAIT